MMALGAERPAVQSPLVRYATQVGWTYLPPEEALRLRRGDAGLVLHEVLVQQLQRLNPDVVDVQKAEEVIRRLLLVQPSIEGNLQAWEFLKGLKTVFDKAENREWNVRFLDPANVEANTFHVTEEFRFHNGIYTIKPDVVFLVNGIPVLIVETKAATKQEGIAEALEQIRRYHREGAELMTLLQLHSLTHLVHYYYGATWNLSRKALFNWRDEQAGDFEALVKTFVEPRRLLRVLNDFILFTRTDGELSKVVLRPHQMRATERVIQRALDPHKRRGLVWHTQGSGKTYTMIAVAKRLIEDPAFCNPTVLMVVDRNELEAQLFSNLEAVGFGYVEVARSKKQLRKLLRNDQGGLIVSMIHKFNRIPANINTRANFFVLVDEAHRTTGGDLGNFLMGALPNATYIGFTGTPIDKTTYGRGTFKVFGTDDPEGYLDKYSIKESIQDGTTVPLHYTLAPNELRVDSETLEREFFNLAELEGVSDIDELNKVLKKAATLKNMLKNKERVKRIAEFVAKHFTETIEPMGYKAFLVGVDREACALYKAALDEHLPKDYSRVVFSPDSNDPPELERYHLTEEEERYIRKAFRKPDELPKILIVTEKLLTGFDAPILYCMYLDKPMRDHVLLQAIARVNRPYEDDSGRKKPSGLVVDFVGIFENLEKALAFDSKEVEGTIEGLEVLQGRFKMLMTRGRTEFLPLCAGKESDKAAEAVLEHFRDNEPRHRFYRYIRELQELYEILSPDPFLRPFLHDYQELVRMYRLVRAAYDPGISVDKSFLRKTATLIQQQTWTNAILEIDPGTLLDEQALDRIANQHDSDTVKVFNLIKALVHIVQQQSRQSPYLISIGERVEQIAQEFQNRQLTTLQALQQLEQLVEELKDAKKAQQEMNLSSEGFTIYWLLKREGVSRAEEIARDITPAFDRYPYWRSSEGHEREVRKDMTKVLIAAEVEPVSEHVERILQMLRRSE
ncbi:MAG: type I restriction endonuclease subunit R [Candidatus Methanomethylicaceae archaeon]